MERALTMRDSSNAEVAARWLEARGVSYELAMLAWVGARRTPVRDHARARCLSRRG